MVSKNEVTYMLLGSIEAGGTKFVCAVGNINYQINTPKKNLTR